VAVAEEYLQAGNYYWNSGIFVWRAATILDQLQQREPSMYARIMSIAAARGHAGFDTVLADQFAAIQGKSIDYAVMEHAENVVVIEAPFAWDDLGSWRSLARLRGEDLAGNTITGRHLGIATTGTIVRTDDEHLVVTVGLKDCIVVCADGITLVADKNREEQVRDVVQQLRDRGWTQFL
jgi:mannose-1-phosphate guanylyltransferase